MRLNSGTPLRLAVGLCLLVSVVAVASLVAAPPAPQPMKAGTAKLRTYTSPIYTVYTDVADDDAKEALIRMNKVAFEYHERTKALFSGTINQALPFYLFSKQEDYFAAGAIPGSAGVFTGDSLMARVIRSRDGHIGNGTWHVVQHEGFHQFVHAVIRGQIPTWVNEGLAEYFGEGVFTGDGMVTGVIPAFRCKKVQQEISSGAFLPLPKMMAMTIQEWNSRLDVVHYDQAWSMVHFLAQAENGKYQDAFARYLQLVGKGTPSERAWSAAFGSVEGFEGRWKEFWTALPDNPTLDLYAQASVATLTSFLARSYSQKETFDSFEEFIKNDAKDLKMASVDWLPPALFTEMKEMAAQLQREGAQFSFTKREKAPLPQILCTMPDGAKITGAFTLGANRIGKVGTEITKPSAETKPAASKAK
jgi:hypothetical protein